MEPGSLRESPAGSGDPKPAEWREEIRNGMAVGNDGKGRAGGGDNIDTFKKTDGEGAEDRIVEKVNIDKKEVRKSEELDPRIQEELEHLNQASEEINTLELQLDEARSSYRRILTDSARKLNAQASHLGTCIEKARPYYEARRLAKEAQQETQRAALRYERAVSMHSAAREMVYVAEQGLMADCNTMDPTWQEMLNHSTCKVNEAEEERVRSVEEHQRVTQQCQQAEARVQSLQNSLRRVILRSKPYFELKAQFNHILEEHKSRVLMLEDRVSKVKTHYSVALRNLEQISEQIHAQRGRGQGAGAGQWAQARASGGRSSPVGAESSDSGVGGRWGSGAGSGAGSDTASLVSLQTIASDLQKCDSIGHLGDFSDSVSLSGEEKAGPSRAGPGGAGQERGEGVPADEAQQNFLKQHYRSASL
ncbi:SH3 domain-binding protein 5-like [Conger conger]|uniref:SH3 domain-binding protein 5-like n=1 Tax=Conger conger TaxID=82655 RepID=UPI002A5A0F38|nr:SH3 domain-binding protein 5-like [Conger conger]